ncbi:CidA/LrgA family protein [Paenibacillus solisilvae]|uniref:CidA/LrgA family protein n=1 Tax=Paenibacillus solisilvae TaxID=2486751 RepID=A0ABW0W290_9BACL
MKFMKVFLQIALLFLFSLAGNAVQQALHLQIPGSIVGMLLLWVCLS